MKVQDNAELYRTVQDMALQCRNVKESAKQYRTRQVSEREGAGHYKTVQTLLYKTVKTLQKTVQTLPGT